MKWFAGSLVALGCLFTLVVLFTPSAEGIVLSGYFDDDDGSTFEGDIDAIAAAGITKGCNPPANTRYCPGYDVDRGAMAAFLRRALGLPYVTTDFFNDDNDSIFEDDINAIAAAGITKGCNPPANTRYCPEADVNRGAMAAFLRRALGLPYVTTDFFNDDNDSIFEDDINAIAAAGITKGCNPPANTAYCVGQDVKRGAMAAFLRRALGLPFITLRIPVSSHGGMRCSKDGERCTMTVDLSANRIYRIQEGLFQVTPASAAEQTSFNSGNTSFRLDVNGSNAPLTELSQRSSGNTASRLWRRDHTFGVGSHTLRARWYWDGELIQTNTLTIRAAG